MGVQVKTVNTDRFSMDCCRFGNGERTLVIVPGLSVQSVMPLAEAIAEQYKAMTDDFTLYVFDRRKDPLPGSYTVQDMADDTAEAIRELGLGPADFFGASQGGMIAMEIAADHPELVNKIIAGSSSARISDEQFEYFDELIALAKAGERKELYLAFGERVYTEEVFEGLKEAFAGAAGTVTDEELARFVRMTEGMRGFDITDKLAGIKCPVLVLGSKTDRVLGGKASEEIAEGLKNSADCELYMYDEYGHAAYDCAPDYQERMMEFLLK